MHIRERVPVCGRVCMCRRMASINSLAAGVTQVDYRAVVFKLVPDLVPVIRLLAKLSHLDTGILCSTDVVKKHGIPLWHSVRK